MMSSDASTIDTLPSGSWDSAAADYAELAEPFTRIFAEQALALAGVIPGERLIDVAAGTGALTLAAARAGARVLGVDFSPGMVALLTARLVAAGHHDCSARVMNGEALEFDEGSFDAAFSIFGVVLFPDWRRGLAELARVVRPGGRGCVTVWSRPEGGGPALALAEAWRIAFPAESLGPPSPGMAVLNHPVALAGAMADVGFRDVVVHPAHGNFTAPSPDWLVDSMDRFYGRFPRYAALDGAERERLREALRKVLHRYAPTGAAGLSLCSMALVAVGRR